MRLFAAVEIGGDTRAELARLRREVEARLRASRRAPRVTWVDPGRAHLTLRFIGEADPPLAARVQDALAAPFTEPAFTVTWDGLGTFGASRAPRVIWMGCREGGAALEALAADVGRRLAGAGVPPDARAFRPHLTLARVREPGLGVPWSDALASVDVRPTRSRVDEVVLVESRLSPRGPSYTAVLRTPLA
ncbi:MAG: RNA 2',3'-cyclic phosphodiesterase [Acidobacteriota bacterium]